MTVEQKVLLLAMRKREPGEGLRDILMMLEHNRVFTLKEGKRLVKKLRETGYLHEGELTLKGEAAAVAAEEEFTLR